MAFDIYYRDSSFESTLRNQEKFINMDLLTAYMRIVNLKQNKNRTYDDTILKENLSQELLKSAMTDKVMERFNNADNNNGLYQDIYDLCLKLMQSLKRNCNIDFKNNDYSAND